jgi:uncharacterized membrane protein
VLAAAAAGLGNVVVTLISSYQQLQLEQHKATLTQSINIEQSRSTLRLEQSKSEAARILEVVKTNDPDKAAVNLRFLLDAGLIDDPDTRKHIQVYLDKRQPGEGFSLPSAVQPPPVPDVFDFKVCNRSSVKLSVAVVGKRMPSMESFNDEGWWTISAGACASLGNFSNSSSLYWTASSTEQSGKTWGRGHTLCIPAVKVDRPHQESCEEGQRRDFSELQAPQQQTYTLTLR